MQRFIEKTDGDANILGLFWSLIAICFVAIAADIARTFSFQAGLQSAADTAGMAVSAEYARTKDIAKAKAAGVAVAAEIMGSSAYLTADDIVFGQYDADATPPTMTENLTEFDAVHVFANALDDNALYQYFFQFVGLDSFDVSAETVYALEVGSVKEPLISTCGNDTTFITHGHFGTLSLNMQTEDPSISNAPYPTHCIHTNRNNGIDMYDGSDPAEKMGFFVAPDSNNGGDNISLSKSGRAHLNDLDPLFITSDSKINNMTELELITEERFIETIFYWQIQEYFNGIFNYIEDTKIKKNSNSISYTYPWTGGASLEINGINQWAQWIMCKDHFEQYQILATSQGHGILPRAIIPEYTCFNVYIFDENFGTVNISRLEDNIIVLAYGDINYTGSTSGAVSRADTGSFDAKNVVLMARGSISFGSGAPLDDQYEWTWANYDHILNLQNSFIFALNKNSRNDHDAYDERCADVAECTYFVYEDGLGNTWARRNHQTRTPRTYADFDDRNFINITLNLGTPDWCDGNDHFNSYLLGLDDFVFNEQVVSVNSSDWHNLYNNNPKSQANFHSVYASGLKFIGGNTELYTSGSYFEVGEEIYFRRISIQNCPHLLISDVLPRANIESTYLNGADILNSLGAGYTPLGETILDENLSQPQDNDYAAEYVIENEEALVH